MILIVGASGKLGMSLCIKLLKEGKTVRCLTRDPQKLSILKKEGAEIFQGDLRDKKSLEKACAGIKTVVATAHSLLGRGKERSKLIDYQGHIDLIDVAKEANVGYFIYVSVLFASPDLPVPFARYKYQVEEYLKNSGLLFSILRPSAFMEDHAYNLIGKPVIEKGKVTILGKGNSKVNYVAAEDVAKFVELAINNEKLQGKLINVGGPENFTANQIVSVYEKSYGTKAKVTHVPVFIMKIMSILLRPFHQGISQILALNSYLETHWATLDMKEILKEYPVELVSLEQWIESRRAQK